MSRYLAFDLGAESGRAILGTLRSEQLTIEELHRFPNTPVRVLSSLYWDTLRLWQEILHGLAVAGRERRVKLEGIGIDTWGVDFALLGSDGMLVDNPRHYRDARTNGMLETAFKTVPRDEIFAQTGIQFMQINTLYQLYAMRQVKSPALACAETLLMMPDLFNYWLTGVAKSELTIASTSQMYNPRLSRWATELFERMDLPKQILPAIVPPGTRLGPLLAEIAGASGLDATPVFASACHDTASAVAAVPARGDSWCYISSGTWSLMGVELDAPVMDSRSLALNLTNEMGVAGKVRLLKNIAGLWLMQECRSAWALQGHEYSYTELTALAETAPPFSAVINPDAFLEPGDMPDKISAHCQANGLRPPDSPATMARTILESLALRYREVLESLESLLGRRFDTIHIVGGGSRNRLLNRFTADATGRTIVAGPAEATAMGNVLTQAIGAGEISGLAAAREIAGRSVALETFTPTPAADWDRAYEKFRAITRRA
ncbi:MAG TPA: rhamnulokinase family protein [Bryobacteraceae bacterium]|nr:rhamnulokinase family protein [Bryobacteraceae bacterium]